MFLGDVEVGVGPDQGVVGSRRPSHSQDKDRVFMDHGCILPPALIGQDVSRRVLAHIFVSGVHAAPSHNIFLVAVRQLHHIHARHSILDRILRHVVIQRHEQIQHLTILQAPQLIAEVQVAHVCELWLGVAEVIQEVEGAEIVLGQALEAVGADGLMVDQVDVHGMVLEQVVNHVEIVHRADLRLIRLSVLEHVVRANHEAGVVGEREKGPVAADRDRTLRDEGEVSEGHVQAQVVGRPIELLPSSEWLGDSEEISLLGQHLRHPLQEGLRSGLDLELILDDSSSLIIVIANKVDIIDPRREFGIEADE